MLFKVNILEVGLDPHVGDEALDVRLGGVADDVLHQGDLDGVLLDVVLEFRIDSQPLFVVGLATALLQQAVTKPLSAYRCI